jgi:hypothetical protein
VSERTQTRERVEATEDLFANERTMVLREQPFKGPVVRYSGANVIGNGTRRFVYVSIALGGVIALPMFEGASKVSYALLVLGCLALAAVVASVGAPWAMRIGIDGLFVGPNHTKRVVRWRELESIALSEAPRGSPIEYVSIDLAWSGGEKLSIPAWSLDGETARNIRDTIEARRRYAREAVEPNLIASIQRASRPVAQWVEALRGAKDAHFRSQQVDAGSLLSALETGALSLIDAVQCAVAVAVLGTSSQRADLARVADQYVDERYAAAIRAASEQRFSDPAIDQATR